MENEIDDETKQGGLFDKKLRTGEVPESSRGSGLQKAVGDLVTCPWCVGPWVALGQKELSE
jgi:Protein of unknown function (DUF1360)